jgi:hypothetical protein
MKDIDAVPGFSAALVFSGSHCRMHVSQWHLNSGTDGISLQSIGNS